MIQNSLNPWLNINMWGVSVIPMWHLIQVLSVVWGLLSNFSGPPTLAWTSNWRIYLQHILSRCLQWCRKLDSSCTLMTLGMQRALTFGLAAPLWLWMPVLCHSREVWSSTSYIPSILLLTGCTQWCHLGATSKLLFCHLSSLFTVASKMGRVLSAEAW